MPLDGVCRFSRERADVRSRPPENIRALLRPRTIGIIGVSEKLNMRRVILKNILAERVLGLPPDIRVDKDAPFDELPVGRDPSTGRPRR